MAKSRRNRTSRVGRRRGRSKVGRRGRRSNKRRSIRNRRSKRGGAAERPDLALWGLGDSEEEGPPLKVGLLTEEDKVLFDRKYGLDQPHGHLLGKPYYTYRDDFDKDNDGNWFTFYWDKGKGFPKNLLEARAFIAFQKARDNADEKRNDLKKCSLRRTCSLELEASKLANKELVELVSMSKGVGCPTHYWDNNQFSKQNTFDEAQKEGKAIKFSKWYMTQSAYCNHWDNCCSPR